MWKQASDELARSLRSDGVRAYRDMIADAEDLVRDWRSRPGPWIETARETPADRGIDGNVLAWHTIEGCHYTVPARTVADYQSEHPLWMEIPEGGIPEPRPEPKSPGDDEMSRIIELANKLTPQQNREMAKYLSGVADLDEERAKRPEPTREQLMRLWEAIQSSEYGDLPDLVFDTVNEIEDEVEAERGRG